MPEPITGAEVEELESLIDLMRSKTWRYIKNEFTKHRLHCVEESHKCLKLCQDRKAGEWLARSEESTRLISLIQGRKAKLESKRETNYGNDAQIS